MPTVLSFLKTHFRPDSTELVQQWANALEQVGGLYEQIGAQGRRAFARGTITTVASCLGSKRLSTHGLRQFAAPPIYRSQPDQEFLLAMIQVVRFLPDYFAERTDDPMLAAAATAQLDQFITEATLGVLRVRAAIGRPESMLSEIGHLLNQRRHGPTAMIEALQRIATTLDADAALVVGVDSQDLTLYASSEPLPLEPGLIIPRVDLPWVQYMENNQQLEGPLETTDTPLHSLSKGGFQYVLIRALMTRGKLSGLLVLLRRRPVPFGNRYEQHLHYLGAILSSQVALARQASALERADSAIDELFDASPNLLCAVDRVGRLIRTNARFRDQIGLADGLIGMPLFWLIHPSWLERSADLWSRICDAPRVVQERLDLITANSERLSLSLDAHWLRDDVSPPRICMIALTNVSKHIEQAAEDQQRIGELTAFAHHIAHDLKAPLRTIAGFISMLREELPEGAEALDEYAERIAKAADRGNALIIGLLDYARTSHGVQRVEVSLSSLVEVVHDQLAGELEARKVELTILADEGPLLGDSAALATLLTNLIGNAIRYTNGEAPQVEITLKNQCLGWTELSVRDYGIGVALADQTRIFGLFERADRLKGGTGVGLAIVQRIAHAHGGSIHLESSLGEGCLFTVRLPSV